MQISKIARITLVGFLSVALCAVGWSHAQQSSQATSAKEAHGIPGYLDPRTGMFRTRSQSPAQASVAVTSDPVIFRLVFNFNILYNDQTGTVACHVSISPFGDTNGLFHSEDATALANGQTCQVTILAQWDLATPSTDQVSIEYEIDSFQTVQGTLENFRGSSHSLASIPMPANGQTVTPPTITVVI